MFPAGYALVAIFITVVIAYLVYALLRPERF